MKKVAAGLSIVLVAIGLMAAASALQDPYPMDGCVIDNAGATISGANVTFTNQNTGEVIYADSHSIGWYTNDAGNFPSGYQDGHVIQYYTVFDAYTNTTTHTIDVSAGSHTMNITIDNETSAAWIPRPTTTTHQNPINESAYDQLDDSLQAANPSWTDFTAAIANPYISMMGTIFFLFLFGVPLLMLYIRQDSMNIPATFVFMFGAFILVLLPPQWQMIGGGLLALALFGAFFAFMKERERG